MGRLIVLDSLTAIWLPRGRECAAEVAELIETARLHADSVASGFRDDVLGYLALVEGRLDDGRAVWRPLASDQKASGLVANVAHLDIWRADGAAAERILADPGASYPNECAGAVIRSGLAAGIAGLRGDRAAAVAGYATLGSRLREYQLAFEEVMFAIEMAYGVGPSEEVARAQIKVARAMIDRLGSPPLQRLLDEALRVGPHPPKIAPAASPAIR
jgi:hypothetical protein